MQKLLVLTFTAITLALPGMAALTNAQTQSDTATAWTGYIDWTSPGGSSSHSFTGTNWSIFVEEVDLGSGASRIDFTAVHLAGSGAPTLQYSLFSPFVGGDLKLAHHTNHEDQLFVQGSALGGGASRVGIQVGAIPEPSTFALGTLGLVSAFVARRRYSA